MSPVWSSWVPRIPRRGRRPRPSHLRGRQVHKEKRPFRLQPQAEEQAGGVSASAPAAAAPRTVVSGCCAFGTSPSRVCLRLLGSRDALPIRHCVLQSSRSTYLSPRHPLSPTSCRAAPRGLLAGSRRAPAPCPSGPGGPGGAQQGPEPSRPGGRERPHHHQAHEPLAVGRPAPGPQPAGLLPLLTALGVQRHMADGRACGLLPSPLKALRTPREGLSLQHRPCCSVSVSAHPGKSPPRAPAPKGGAGTKAGTFCHVQSLGVTYTCPPPANNMYFICGRTVLKRRSVPGRASSSGSHIRRGGARASGTSLATCL